MPDTPIDQSASIQSIRLKVPTGTVPVPPVGFGQLHSPSPGVLALRLPDGSVVAVGPAQNALSYADLHLPDAQIKTLPTTGVTLLPAPAAGLRVWPDLLVAHLKIVAGGDYTNVQVAAKLLVAAGVGLSAFDAVLFTASEGEWDAAYTVQYQLPEGAGGSYPSGGGTTVPVTLSVFNSPDGDVDSGPFTGGNASNTLTLRFFYRLAPNSV